MFTTNQWISKYELSTSNSQKTLLDQMHKQPFAKLTGLNISISAIDSRTSNNWKPTDRAFWESIEWLYE